MTTQQKLQDFKTFAGRAWSEAKLLRLAYAYEQASNARRPPPGLPAL